MCKDIIILGIESSCDDTSAAVLVNNEVISNITASQAIHAKYGGVVPELASRAHLQHIIPVVHEAIKEADIELSDLSAIAYTNGPGLLGSLLVGSNFAKSLALGLDVPAIPVNHMQGHVMSHLIKTEAQSIPAFPFICLTVSGGHTELVIVKAAYDMKIVGHTIDDAAGEAFDKAAKILGLPYPGGPLIDHHAKQGNPERFEFTFPNAGELHYSFSGLKTQFSNFVNNQVNKSSNFIQENLADICASYQQHIIHYLLKNLDKLVKDTGIKKVAIAGGVSANSALRSVLKQKEETHQWEVYIPKMEYCTDNAAMIGIVGYYAFKKKKWGEMSDVPNPRLKLADI